MQFVFPSSNTTKLAQLCCSFNLIVMNISHLFYFCKHFNRKNTFFERFSAVFSIKNKEKGLSMSKTLFEKSF